jgi:hypothetical protein
LLQDGSITFDLRNLAAKLSAQIYAQAGDKLVALNKFPKAPGRLHGLTGSEGLARSAA